LAEHSAVNRRVVGSSPTRGVPKSPVNTGDFAFLDADVVEIAQVIGASSESWETAARVAVETAAQTVRDLRIAEVVREDMTIEDGRIREYRVRLNVSFRYETAA
jgi:dodecin